MAEILVVGDLPTLVQSDELVTAMVAGANAKASRVAPCLAWDGSEEDKPGPTADQLAEAKLVLIGAVKRWAEAGAGALQAQQAGPFGMTIDTRQRTGFNLWPSEIEALQDICASVNPEAGKAFSIDTAPSLSGMHVPWCSLSMGATFCSCGTDIAGEPIFEMDA